MQRSPKPPSGQFALALYPEAIPHLDKPREEELLKVLAELMLEALGAEPAENQGGKENSDESEDHA